MAELRAFCSSVQCDPKQMSAKGVEKIVERGAHFCPDCRKMLVWKNPRSRVHYLGKFNRRTPENQQSPFDNV